MDGNIESLFEKYADYFDIGAAVNERSIVSHDGLIKKHFNGITAENAMKPENLLRSLGEYDFTNADFHMDYARDNGLRLRGHTLVWHNQTPDWFFMDGGGFASRQTVLCRLKDYITAVVKHFGRAYCWDVVNEAVGDGGDSDRHRADSKWFGITGWEYFEKAFEYAHLAAPELELFYNDYSLETNGTKRETVVKLLSEMKGKGVPIHGIGIQGHFGCDSPTPDQIRATVEDFAALNLKIHFTEIDMSVYGSENGESDFPELTDVMLENQAERYGEFFRIFREYRDVIRSVSFWGVADDMTWLHSFPAKRNNWPLLFDGSHRPKPCFDRIMDF